MSEVISMWRCTECGKWSHAQRRPRWHSKFVGDELPDDAIIVDSNETMEQDTGAKYDVFWIRCGPFEEWIAEPVRIAVTA